MELIIAVLVIYCIARRTEKKMARDRTCQKIHFAAHYPNLQRSIDEELSVINKTKDVETGIRCFAVIRRNLAKIAALSPSALHANITVGGQEMCRELALGGGDTDDSLEKVEREWIRQTVSEIVEAKLVQAEALSNHVLNIDLVREALKIALKGLEYLPNDKQLKIMAGLAERRLSLLAGAGSD